MVREQMQQIVAQFAMAALGVGMLVRGGLSRGKLYHRGRVVVGEAMVDAYRLESEVARHPLVVVSSRIHGDDRLFIDKDGLRCLDYIGTMMILAEDRFGDARAWTQEKLAGIEATISDLIRNKQLNEAAKWVYFRDNLRFLMETWAAK
jgi:hypothetical protein